VSAGHLKRPGAPPFSGLGQAFHTTRHAPPSPLNQVTVSGWVTLRMAPQRPHLLSPIRGAPPRQRRTSSPLPFSSPLKASPIATHHQLAAALTGHSVNGSTVPNPTRYQTVFIISKMNRVVNWKKSPPLWCSKTNYQILHADRIEDKEQLSFSNQVQI
jgi:hypothetical protein